MNKEEEHKKIITSEFEIVNKYGIHARPAAMFVKTASLYNAEITVFKGDNMVSGKSIMGLMTLEASYGSKLRITAEGDDAHEAVNELKLLIERKFDED